tara:strand:- start:2871 stop:3104 length:234 start_codon:yes stop_codon:yes gene_type:complete
MIIKPLSTEYAADNAAIAAARVVRLVNTGATEKVAIGNSTPAELTILANTSVVIEKEVGAAVAATGSVLATIVAFTN